MLRTGWSVFVLVSLAGMSSLSAQVQAQAAARSAPPAPAPAARPRIGYAASPTPAPAPAPTRAPAPVYVYAPGGYIVSGAPYQVLSDGSVLVDFGNGYERVLRPCAPVRASQAEANQAGRDALGRILDPPGIAALKAGTRGQATGTAPDRNGAACYRSARGGVEMVTTP